MILKKLPTKEIITFLNTKERKGDSVRVFQTDTNELSCSEETLYKKLWDLQRDGFIVIKSHSPHNDLSIPCEVILKEKCVNYKRIRKTESIHAVIEVIKFLIPMLMYYDGKWGIGDDDHFQPIGIEANNEYIQYAGSKYYHK